MFAGEVGDSRTQHGPRAPLTIKRLLRLPAALRGSLEREGSISSHYRPLPATAVALQ